MKFYTLAALTFPFLLPLAAAQKKVLIQDIGRQVGSPLEALLKPAAVGKKNTWTDKIPTDCVDEARRATSKTNNAHRCKIDDLTVKEVWFNDSPQPWIICKCSDTKFSEDEMLKDIGRLPVGLRQRTRYFMGFREGGGAGALATGGGDILFFQVGITIAHHEGGHQMDKGRLSTSKEYADAVKKDTCWATPYAKQTGEAPNGGLAEAWAETFVFRRLIKSGGALPVNSDCMKNQLDVVGKQTDAVINGGYKAELKIPNGPITGRAKVGNMLRNRELETLPAVEPERFDVAIEAEWIVNSAVE